MMTHRLPIWHILLILINDRVGNLLETNEGLAHETAEALKELMFAIADAGGADNISRIFED